MFLFADDFETGIAGPAYADQRDPKALFERASAHCQPFVVNYNAAL